MDKVSEISETCDWKSVFGPEEIVNLIAEIIENNPKIVLYPDRCKPDKNVKVPKYDMITEGYDPDKL